MCEEIRNVASKKNLWVKLGQWDDLGGKDSGCQVWYMILSPRAHMLQEDNQIQVILWPLHTHQHSIMHI